MAYPDDIYVQRPLDNLPGVEFDEKNTKTLYAEDIMRLGSEIRNIELTLGTNFEPGGGGELPVGTVWTTTIDLEDEPPFDYGTWELIASGQLFGNKISYTYERTD